MNYDLQYLDILKEVIANGIWKDNRTNMRSKYIPSASIVWDLRKGFPVLTSKKVFYKSGIGEYLGFLQGASTAKDFAKLGCKWWYSDANENKQWLSSPYRKGADDLGKVYGVTWRNREVFKTVDSKNSKMITYLENIGYIKYGESNNGTEYIYIKNIDSISDSLDLIVNNPNNRRNIFHAWFPELFDEMALPPCHAFYEFVADVENNTLHMTMTQRSCDLLLGVPFNLLGAALILSIFAKATGYKAGVLTHSMTDVHLYENQIEAAEKQLAGDIRTPPTLVIRNKVVSQTPLEYIVSLQPKDFTMVNYIPGVPLPRVAMAQEK